MGYDIHITRREDWSDENDLIITRDEVLALVNSRSELQVEDESQAEFMITRNGRQEDWIMHDESGNLRSKNPSKEMVVYMWTIAQELGAILQGDDGEIYGDDGRPEGSSVQTDPPTKPTGFLGRLFGRR